VRRWLTLEAVGLGVFVFVGLALVHGHGWEGFAAFIGMACLVGAVVGLIGRRYPMIYSQNRRDRRRRQRSDWQSQRDRERRRSN
jgi:predicted alpha/beta-hydrolase family hydrolase